MSNKLKKIIKIIIVILIIILIGVLILIGKVNKKNNSDVIEYENEIEINDILEKEKTRSNYYTVKNIVEKYYSSLCNLNKKVEDVLIFEYDEEVEHIEEETAQEIQITKDKIYNFFDENYIKDTNLNINSLQEKLGNYNNLYVLIEDMYVREIATNLKTYFVFGTIVEKTASLGEKFELMIAIDSKNFTFNIYTSDYINKYNLYELSKEANFNEDVFCLTGIENRKYNKYENKAVNNEEHAKNLLENFTQSIKYNNIEYSYSRLNEEYKIKKFKDFSDYEKYIERNKNNITKAYLNYYKSNKQEGFTQYICVDKSERYYIFNEAATMDYNLILDNYTIDIQEFVDKYNNSSEKDKVLLNVQKVIAATKDGDYKYVYSKLDNGFKSANLQTQEKFEKFIKEKYNEKDIIEFTTYEKINNTHVYLLEITKSNGNKTKAQIVMQLKDGTDFVMSFSPQK